LKKLAVAGIVLASALTLTACGSSGYGGYDGFNDGYSNNGGWNSSDWDMNNPSIWNNNSYCHGGTYQPLAGNQYSCVNNGVTSRPSARPKAPVVPPKTQQAPPKEVQQKRQQITQQRQQQQKQNSAPRQNSAPKAPSAPRPAAKSGK
jgi:hypothetical protein